jgi:sec-independent protein translocase protein TatA
MSFVLLGILNTPEIIALAVLALIFFGAKKLPEMARGLGHGIREFKKATQDVNDELQHAMNSEPPPAPKQPYSAPAPQPVPPAELAATTTSPVEAPPAEAPPPAKA